MQTNLQLRNDMMELSKTALDGASVKEIQFLDASDMILCQVPYLSYVQKALTGESAVYEFIGLDGTTSLKAGVATPGQASKFRIYGDLGSGDVIIFNGSVGTTANFDFEFNSVTWAADTFITIKDVTILIRQGA